jgi:2-oxoglutarate/2-oxoacid ferredoxin oxidoreductase subunit beta
MNQDLTSQPLVNQESVVPVAPVVAGSDPAPASVAPTPVVTPTPTTLETPAPTPLVSPAVIPTPVTTGSDPVAKPQYPILPTWCPGCGNFGILNAIKMAIAKTGLPKEKFVIVYDIGCSGNMADFLDMYGFHGLHGRAIPPAAGIKLANHDLKVIVIIGDGGCYGEGATHFINLMRGNHDITVLVHDNHRYALTTGQMSPTTDKGEKTKSTPEGAIEEPINPLALAVSNHASFIAREFSGAIPQLSARILEAINHPGFAMIDILQICAVYNKKQDLKWYRENTIALGADHNHADKGAAWSQTMRTDKLPVGLFYKEEKASYHSQVSELQSATLVNHDKTSVNLETILTEYL